MKKIDEIFKNSQHEKALEVRPELWARLERQMDQEQSPVPVIEPKRAWIKPWKIAASLALIFAMTALLYLNIETYEVEDLQVEVSPNFSKEEVAGLENAWIVPQRIFVNPEVI